MREHKQSSKPDPGEVMSKAGEILYAKDGLAVMRIPNGLLIGDQIYEGEVDFSIIKETEGLTPDRVVGMCLALIVLSNPQQQFRLPEKAGVAEGFAKVMHMVNNGIKASVENPGWLLWCWLQVDLTNMFLVHPYNNKLVVAMCQGLTDIKHPF